MLITLENNFVVEVDESQFTLKENTLKKDKKGNSVYKVYGYYGELESAIKKYALLNVINYNKELTLKEYVEEYKCIVNRIELMLNE